MTSFTVESDEDMKAPTRAQLSRRGGTGEGFNFECRDPSVIICKLWKCQKANACQATRPDANTQER